MSTLSLHELLELAKRVYPESRAEITSLGISVCVDGLWTAFNPSLIGSDRQLAQALRVIVKAYRERGITWLKDERGFPILEYQMLDYAARAVLANGGKI